MRTVFLPSLYRHMPPAVRSVLHEIVAGPGHPCAGVSFGLGLMAETLAQRPPDAMLLWVREGAAMTEAGDVYGPGVAALGLSPNRLVVAQLRTLTDALRAALEGARCPALAAVILETASPIDLTASRRLKLAAEKSQVEIVLLRPSGSVVPNAAQVRWGVRATCERVTPDGRWRAAFEVTVLKHPAGLAECRRIMEWDHDRRCFAETLPLPVDAVPAARSLAA